MAKKVEVIHPELETEEISESLKKRVTPYMKKFEEYVRKNGLSLTAQNCRQWDEQFNNKKILRLLGSSKDVYEAGVKALFSRLVSNFYQVLIHVPEDAEKVSIGGYEPTRTSRLAISGVQKGVHLATMTKAQHEFLKQEYVEKLGRYYDRCTTILSMTRAEINRYFDSRDEANRLKMAS